MPLGAPPVYTPTTSFAPDAPLPVDRDAALVLADWYALGARAARTTCAPRTRSVPSSDAQLWPEHFDLACELGDADAGTRANYGASPGDARIPEPYLYVGPWDAGPAHGRARHVPVRRRVHLRRAAARRRGRRRGPPASSSRRVAQLVG